MRRALGLSSLCLALIAGLSVSLSGCMVVGPDYSRPAIDTPAAYRETDPTARDLVTLDTKNPKGRAVLDALITEAVTNNYSVKVALANVEAASAILMQQRSALSPQIGYQGKGQHLNLSNQSEINGVQLGSSAPNSQTTYSLMLSASWELDLWGRIRRLSESAQANILANDAARRGVVLSLVGSVANAYIQLRSLDAQLAIARRTLGTYAESVRLFELQFKYGQISQLTLEQSRSQYEAAAAVIPQLENSIAVTENTLCALLGRNPGPIARGKTLSELIRPAVPTGLPSQLLERRPDIDQAEQQLIAANALIGAAKALYFPSISLTGGLGASSNQLSNLISGGKITTALGAAITGPLFTGGLIAGQVNQAQAQQKAATFNYLSVVQSAFVDVNNALVGRIKLGEQIRAEKRRVDALRETLRLSILRYDGGYADYLSVLYAQQQLFPAELAYAQDLGQSLAAVVKVYLAMGGSWVDVAANP
ncbi:MAG: efflux transporter outer membrane subunit [Burkholderiales bacterium]